MSRPTELFGIDVGTTRCKAAVVDASGAPVHVASRAMPWRTVPTGAELSATDLLDCVLVTVREALVAAGSPAIRAVGVTSIAESGFVVRPDGTAPDPAVAWYDTRGEELAADLAGFGPKLAERTGRQATARLTAVVLRWLAAHRGVPPAGSRWLGVAEFVAHTLGAAQVAEASLASRSGLLDIGSGTWLPDVLEWTGAPSDLLPEVVDASTAIGTVRAGIPGLQALAGAVIAVAGHDHLCCMVGSGATRSGDLLNSAGTSEAFARSVGTLGPGLVGDVVSIGGTVSRHVLPGRYAVLAPPFPTGLALQRVLALLGVPAADAQRRTELDHAASHAPTARVRIDGFGTDAMTVVASHPVDPPTAPEIWRAAVEVAADTAAARVNALAAVSGPVARTIVVGGWGASSLLQTLKKARLPNVVAGTCAEAGIAGAALLAASAAGIRSDPREENPSL